MNIKITADILSRTYAYNFSGWEVVVLLSATLGFVFFLKFIWGRISQAEGRMAKARYFGIFIGSYLAFAVMIKLLGH